MSEGQVYALLGGMWIAAWFLAWYCDTRWRRLSNRG